MAPGPSLAPAPAPGLGGQRHHFSSAASSSSPVYYLSLLNQINGRGFLVLGILILLFSGFVASAPSANSPAEIVSEFILNHGSSLMKWLWSLKTTTKSTIATRSMVKFGNGYTVDTVFGGSKLGIKPYSIEVLPRLNIL